MHCKSILVTLKEKSVNALQYTSQYPYDYNGIFFQQFCFSFISCTFMSKIHQMCNTASGDQFRLNLWEHISAGVWSTLISEGITVNLSNFTTRWCYNSDNLSNLSTAISHPFWNVTKREGGFSCSTNFLELPQVFIHNLSTNLMANLIVINSMLKKKEALSLFSTRSGSFSLEKKGLVATSRNSLTF